MRTFHFPVSTDQRVLRLREETAEARCKGSCVHMFMCKLFFPLSIQEKIYNVMKVKKSLIRFIYTDLFNALFIKQSLRQNVWSVSVWTVSVLRDCAKQHKEIN